MNATSETSLYVGLAHCTGQQSAHAVVPVGLLKIAQRGTVASGEFAYGSQYLRRPDAQALNPLHLPLQEALVALPERRLRDGGALPLTMRDALPDSWGRKVLQAQHGGPLSDVQALLLTNADRVGAMVFSATLPIHSNEPAPELFALEDLAHAARQLELGEEPDAKLKRLLQGGSLGGARPKATFIHQERRHIAKFAARGDEHNVAILEACTLALARECGITVPPFFLHPVPSGDALVLQRFDRCGTIAHEQRRHYLSASALLNVAYEDNAAGSYVELAQTLRRLSCEPRTDVLELYRRMVFNLVVGNTDDHVKNHGVLLLYDANGTLGYRLAPAFDLVMQLSGNSGYQSLALLPGEMASSLALARAAAPQFGLGPGQADTVIREIEDTVDRSLAGVLQRYGADAALVRRSLDFVQRQRVGIRT